MSMIVPLPTDVTGLLRHFIDGDDFLTGVHPGLTLDKFALSWNDSGITQGLSERVQRPVIDQVVRLSQSPPPGLNFADLFQRWESTVKGAVTFTGTTAAPFTLHLARASALENAGICLHRIYGFTYLPGTGLKGLAHAYACEVWFPEQSNKEVAWNTICRVFGTAPSPWLRDLAKHLNVDNPKESRAGAVVFHDAWPTKWPRLQTDILNSHHKAYYENSSPPGDWEDPVPVYFLSVEPGTKFCFAVAPRRDDTAKELVQLAEMWLIGGLTTLGAGAKTASGYGDFTLDDRPAKPITSTQRPSFTATLELVTPAFLAGAKQEADDCDLRPATLRGQLRWWWRTMHAGFVDVATLRRMEAAVWGDTKVGGAVRVTVKRVGTVTKAPFERYAIGKENRLPEPPDKKTTQGLTYHSYGMDEKKDGVLVRRTFVAPGAKWEVTLTARPGFLAPLTDKEPSRRLGTDLVLAQARAALGLLCRFGGVGAKGRKGFGSFADLPDFDLSAFRRSATEFRAACTLGTANFGEARAVSPALEQMLGPVEENTGGVNHWLALDQLAAAAQQFAKRYKHRLEKKALGLPRKIGTPASGAFRPGPHVGDRHAAPVLYHLARAADGKLVARVVAFPAAELPNLADSRKLLTELLNELRETLPNRFRQHVAGKATAPTGSTRTTAAQRSSGTPVKVTILAPRPKGGFDVQEAGRSQGTLTLGTPPEGVSLHKDEVVDVLLHVDNVNKPQYKWPPTSEPGVPKKGK